MRSIPLSDSEDYMEISAWDEYLRFFKNLINLMETILMIMEFEESVFFSVVRTR